MRKITWIIWVSPKGDHQCPYKKQTGGLHRHKDRDTWKRQPCKDKGGEWSNAVKEARETRN